MENFFRESGVKWLWGRIKTLLSTKQDKLVSGSNIKTINGTSVLGSGNIIIEGGGDASGSVDEGRLVWSANDIQNNTTLLDNLYRDTIGNKLAFCNPNSINVEYSQDNGSTWENYNLSDDGKTVLVTPVVGVSTLKLGKRDDKSAGDQLRITIDAQTADIYFKIRKILIKLSDATQADKDNGYPTHCIISFQRNVNYNTDTWEIYKDTAVIGGNTWVSLEASGLPAFGNTPASYIRQIRLTFYMPNGCGAYKCRVKNITFIAQSITSGGNVFAKTGHLYEIDVKQNATFPAAITATKHITKGGNANQVVLGNGSLKPISELSPITDADADILLDNHIHNIDVYANGNDVNISVIESSKNGNSWETEDNDITIPLATATSAGVMSKEDKAKLNDLSVIEIKYTLTELEYNNHEIVNLYGIVYAISKRLYNNGWLYNDDKSYDVVVKGWVDNRYNAITYANFNVRLLTTQDGHSLGINGYVDVAQITETNENADCPLWVGYICGKYHIEDDGMAFYAPENPNFIVEA